MRRSDRSVAGELKVGDAVWIATALLHQEFPQRTSFEVEQITQGVKKHHLTGKQDISVYVHANQHCVANRPPNPAKLKMLIETPDGGRRLYRAGERAHPDRNGRVTPRLADLPAQYRPLLAWYEGWSRTTSISGEREDPLLALRGTGKDIWGDEDADAYLQRLRQDLP